MQLTAKLVPCRTPIPLLTLKPEYQCPWTISIGTRTNGDIGALVKSDGEVVLAISSRCRDSETSITQLSARDIVL